MIPQRQIPQVPIGQAIANQNALLAQFQNARQMAQQAPVQAIQGQGVTPAQLMQYAQGNALQVRNRMDGVNQTREDIDTGKDVRARERFQEGMEKQIYTDDRADSRNIYSNNQANIRNKETLDRNDALAEKNATRADKNTHQNFLNDKMVEEIRKANGLDLQERERELKEQFRQENRDYEQAQKKIFEGRMSPTISGPIIAEREWTKPGGGLEQKHAELKNQFASQLAGDPGIIADFLNTELGQQYKDVPLDDSRRIQATIAYAQEQLAIKGTKAQAKFMTEKGWILQRDTQLIKQLANAAWAQALKLEIPIDFGATQGAPNAQGGANALTPGAPSGTVPAPSGAQQTLPGQTNPTGVPAPVTPPVTPPDSLTPEQNALTPEQNAHILENFPDVDADGDGNATQAEMDAFMANPIIPQSVKDFASEYWGSAVAGLIATEAVTPIERGQPSAKEFMKGGKGATPDDVTNQQVAKQQLGKDQKGVDKAQKKLDGHKNVVTQVKDKLSTLEAELKDKQKVFDDAQNKRKFIGNTEAEIKKLETDLKNAQVLNNNSSAAKKIQRDLSAKRTHLGKLQAELSKLNPVNGPQALQNIKNRIAAGKTQLANAESNVKTGKQSLKDANNIAKNSAKDPAKAAQRVQDSKKLTKLANHNARMKQIATDLNISNKELKKFTTNGRIDPAKLQDAIAKQKLGGVTGRLRQLSIKAGMPESRLGKVGLIGFATLLPQIYDFIKESKLSYDEREELANELKKYREGIRALREAAAEPNAVNVDQNQTDDNQTYEIPDSNTSLQDAFQSQP